MSALRLNPPGKPIVLVDQGPAVGRLQPYGNMRKLLEVALTEPRVKLTRQPLAELS